MNAGWYQIRIAGQDVDEASVSARLHESLPLDGAIIPYCPAYGRGKTGGLFQVVLGAMAISASFTRQALQWQLGSSAIAGGISVSWFCFLWGPAMMLGGVARC